MPRGSSPGERRGGRKPGIPNKKSVELQEKIDRLGGDPEEALIRISMRDVSCGVCFGTGKTKYKVPGTERMAERVCESCYGTLKEKINPDLMFKASAELMSYLRPKRKAIEVTGEGGGPVQHAVRMVIVSANGSD